MHSLGFLWIEEQCKFKPVFDLKFYYKFCILIFSHCVSMKCVYSNLSLVQSCHCRHNNFSLCILSKRFFIVLFILWNSDVRYHQIVFEVGMILILFESGRCTFVVATEHVVNSSPGYCFRSIATLTGGCKYVMLKSIC